MTAAAAAACSAVRAEKTTSCPAREMDGASALPTLPAPMMATFMRAVLLSFVFANDHTLWLVHIVCSATLAVVKTSWPKA